jgi:predicted nucleic acid-binding protein
MIVVDTNIILYLFINGEYSEAAEIAHRRDPEWIAPILWRSEFQNVMALYLREGRLAVGEAAQVMDAAERLMQGAEHQPATPPVLALVNESTCSAYDCEFVALARDLGVRLVTVDRQILRDFPEDAVPLGEFAVR